MVEGKTRKGVEWCRRGEACGRAMGEGGDGKDGHSNGGEKKGEEKKGGDKIGGKRGRGEVDEGREESNRLYRGFRIKDVMADLKEAREWGERKMKEEEEEEEGNKDGGGKKKNDKGRRADSRSRLIFRGGGGSTMVKGEKEETRDAVEWDKVWEEEGKGERKRFVELGCGGGEWIVNQAKAR